MVETAPDGYLGLALAERIEAQRGALDLVVVQGKLARHAAEVFVMRLRDTSFGRRAVMIWLGEGGETAKVDAMRSGSRRIRIRSRRWRSNCWRSVRRSRCWNRWRRRRAAAASWWSRTTR